MILDRQSFQPVLFPLAWHAIIRNRIFSKNKNIAGMFVPQSVQKRLEGAAGSKAGSTTTPSSVNTAPQNASAKNAPIYDLYDLAPAPQAKSLATASASADTADAPAHELNEWLLPLGILPDTLAALRADEWSSKLEMLAMENEDVQSLPITKGQKRLLWKIVEKCVKESANGADFIKAESSSSSTSLADLPTIPLKEEPHELVELIDDEANDQTDTLEEAEPEMVAISSEEDNAFDEPNEAGQAHQKVTSQAQDLELSSEAEQPFSEAIGKDGAMNVGGQAEPRPAATAGTDEVLVDSEDVNQVVGNDVEDMAAAGAKEQTTAFEGETIGVDKETPGSNAKNDEVVADGTAPEPSSEGSVDPDDLKVFVGRVDMNTTTEDLIQYFSKFGEVVSAYVPQPNRG